MEIYYQGYKGAYSHQVGLEIANDLKIGSDKVKGCLFFKDVFDNVVSKNGIGIIPIENSYAGSVHENFFYLLKNPIKIIGEYYLPIEHCLVGLTENIGSIKKAFSHYQALLQCSNFLEKNNIEPVSWGDTAGSAKYIKEKGDITLGAISSKLAAEIYGLKIIKEKINDQQGNTTRFLIIIKNNFDLKLSFNSGKISLVFKVKDMPAVLYKCLGAFATRNINLTKIESIPTKQAQFEYMFWLDFLKPSKKEILNEILNELSFFAKEIKILGDY